VNGDLSCVQVLDDDVSGTGWQIGPEWFAGFWRSTILWRSSLRCSVLRSIFHACLSQPYLPRLPRLSAANL